MPAKHVQPFSVGVDPGFSGRWLAQAVRLHSFSSAQLERAESDARSIAAQPEARVLHWAALLAQHTQLQQTMHSWRQRAGAILVLMLLLAFAGGLSAALGVMGDASKAVNVLWALGALLGINMLMLILWFFSLAMTPGAMSAGHLWFWLSSRLQGREALTLTQAFAGLSQRAAATRWWLASISHMIWLVALSGAFAGLLIALSLRGYLFVWETTILPASVFGSVVQALGYLPSLLGFPVPDEAAVQAAGFVAGDAVTQSDQHRRAWAGWLCGAVLVYGVLPRLLLLAFSLWQSTRRLQQVRLALHSAEWSALNERLTPPSQSLGITDPAPAQAPTAAQPRHLSKQGQGPVVIAGFELGEQIDWPPALANGVGQATLEQVASRQQRSAVLQLLDHSTPRALLLICDAAQTVDRGSLAWLGEASGRVLNVAVWLAGNGSAQRRLLWRQQLQTLGLTAEAVFDTESEVAKWLESYH